MFNDKMIKDKHIMNLTSVGRCYCKITLREVIGRVKRRNVTGKGVWVWFVHVSISFYCISQTLNFTN